MASDPAVPRSLMEKAFANQRARLGTNPEARGVAGPAGGRLEHLAASAVEGDLGLSLEDGVRSLTGSHGGATRLGPHPSQ
eukprot:6887784-Pyramimonas_sp.AAC.1